jgi:hypothetical protein
MKKLIKHLLAITFFTAASLAHAEEIDILDHYSPTGLAAQLTKEIADMPGFSSTLVNLGRGNCAGVLEHLKTTQKPTIAIWFWFMHEFGSNEACRNLDQDLFITAYTIAYLNICSTETENNISKFNSGNFKIGYPAHYSNEITLFKQLFNSLEIKNTQFIPYGGAAGAKDVRAAIEIGEIDYGIFTTPSSDLNCEITTDPNTIDKVSIYSLGNTNKDIIALPLFTTFIIIGNNIDYEYLSQHITKLTSTKEWKLKFADFYTGRVTLTRIQQLDLFKLDLQRLKEVFVQ